MMKCRHLVVFLGALAAVSLLGAFDYRLYEIRFAEDHWQAGGYRAPQGIDTEKVMVAMEESLRQPPQPGVAERRPVELVNLVSLRTEPDGIGRFDQTVALAPEWDEVRTGVTASIEPREDGGMKFSSVKGRCQPGRIGAWLWGSL
ncbi:MAG: hypothetical protein EA425_17365 [Puniceicoccaceae bacterium]|nr:MAG: hypothetical protein EA425_17365 [Puniceicoccaceae bacterium]